MRKIKDSSDSDNLGVKFLSSKVTLLMKNVDVVFYHLLVMSCFNLWPVMQVASNEVPSSTISRSEMRLCASGSMQRMSLSDKVKFLVLFSPLTLLIS